MLGKLVSKALDAMGMRIIAKSQPIYGEVSQGELDADFMAAFEKCSRFTMTSVERMYASWTAAHYVVANGIPGDFAECGVWRGGSVLLLLSALIHAGDTTRDVYLYDTFAGMTKPTAEDRAADMEDTESYWRAAQKDGVTDWCYGSLEEVQHNLSLSGYPKERLHFVKGPVEQTVPSTVPDSLAYLRLDTDWYESTRHEMVHLYPLLNQFGVLLIDDYGHWQGARKAVDEYFAEKGLKPLIFRTDYTGRALLKLEPKA